MTRRTPTRRPGLVGAAAVVLAAGLLLRHELVGDHLEPTAWFLVGVEGSTLTLTAEHGMCEKFGHLKVSESAESVTIAAFRRVPNHVGSCGDRMDGRCGTVTLAQPLGERTLRHASPPYQPARPDAPRRAPENPCGPFG